MKVFSIIFWSVAATLNLVVIITGKGNWYTGFALAACIALLALAVRRATATVRTGKDGK